MSLALTTLRRGFLPITPFSSICGPGILQARILTKSIAARPYSFELMMIRHGQTEKRTQNGELDLSANGIREMQETALHIKQRVNEKKISAIFRSHMQRAQTSAKIIRQELGIKKEIEIPEMEGKSTPTCISNNPEQLELTYKRALASIRMIYEYAYKKQDEAELAIIHGEWLRILLWRIFGWNKDLIKIDTGALISFTIKNYQESEQQLLNIALNIDQCTKCYVQATAK